MDRVPETLDSSGLSTVPTNLEEELLFFINEFWWISNDIFAEEVCQSFVEKEFLCVEQGECILIRNPVLENSGGVLRKVWASEIFPNFYEFK